ncbi:hypothetical protein EJ08DRAFT_663825 [Tothia fuscella]|uniref:Uncharacterized protein n=1 Tax=Tothia fuscella TaxID=1048955 RepID=A0A9P4NKB2_9PEZI|nr:hypothetical protein EJ08DRAFT_663825 [Tothia fuscella]
MRFANLPLLGFGLAAFVAAKEVQNYGCPVEGTTVYCYDQKWAEYRIGDLKNGDNFGCNDMHQAIPFCCNIDSMETDNPKCEFVVRLPDGPYKQSLKECKKQEMDTYACIDKTTGDIEKMPSEFPHCLWFWCFRVNGPEQIPQSRVVLSTAVKTVCLPAAPNQVQWAD